MSYDSKISDRLKESAENLARALAAGSNAPLDDYLDKDLLVAIANTAGIEPEQWNDGVLESIFIIRDDLLDIRDKLRDNEDESEHSITQILAAIDSLYLDLQRQIKVLDGQAVAKAESHLRELQHGGETVPLPGKSSARSLVAKAANEVFVQSNVTVNKINISFIDLKNANIDVEILKKASLEVRKLNAHVLAIKFSLRSSVVYQGTISFLSDSVDAVVARMKEFGVALKGAYQTSKDLVENFDKLSVVGGRFAKIMASFMKEAFDSQDEEIETSVKLSLQSQHTSAALTSCLFDKKSGAIAVGRSGQFLQLDPSSTRLLVSRSIGSRDITCLATLPESRMALGTADGLLLASFQGGEVKFERSSYSEHVVKVVSTPWGGAGIGLVTASRDGQLRRWSVASGLSQYRYGLDERTAVKRVGRPVNCLRMRENILIVAVNSEIVMFDEQFDEIRRIPLQFAPRDMRLLADGGILACGDGALAQIDSDSGVYTRMLNTPSNQKYCSVVSLDSKTIAVATDDGALTAFDFYSGIELGRLSLDMIVRDMEVINRRLFIVGGGWHSERARAATFVTWEKSEQITTIYP